MSILVTADLHLGDQARDQYRHDFMKTLATWVARKYVPDVVVILGDLCEEKDRHSAWLVNQVVKHMLELAKWAPVIVLKGNHDYVDIDTPFYAFLGRFSGVTWVNTPTDSETLPIPLKKALGRVLFLPHTPNYERDWKGLSFRGYDWIFAHNTFQGAKVGFGRELNGIPCEVFPDGCNVISGDIHTPQDLPQITYVGAPYTVDFGDDYKPRVLLLSRNDVDDAYDDTLLIKSIPCPGPQKRLVEVTRLGTDLKRFFKEVNPGDILKVRVFLDPSEHDKWPNTKALVNQYCIDNGYLVHAIQPVIDRTSSMSTKKKAAKPMLKSDEELLGTYAQSRGVNERTLKTGLNLMAIA